MGLMDLFSRKPTIESFARELVGRFERMGHTGWTFDAASGELKQASGQLTMNLTNMFLEYSQADRKFRPELLEKYCAIVDTRMREIPKLWTLAQKNIYPVLRSRFDLVALEISKRNSGKNLPSRVSTPWFGDIALRIAYDFGPHTSAVDQQTAETWGVSFAELRARAQQNLNALPRPRWVSVAEGVYQVETDASYEEAMVLRADTWRDLPVPGDKVMIPMNRGVLLGASAEQPEHVLNLLRAAREALQSKPWPLEPALVTRRGDELVAFVPQGPAQVAFEALQKLAMGGVYKDQQDALQAHLGEEHFVATYSLFSRNDSPDALTSYCTWTQDVPSWLPRTDIVAFNKALPNNEWDRALVSWEDAIRICGHYMKPQSEDPPRWFVNEFPNDAEWQQLQAIKSA